MLTKGVIAWAVRGGRADCALCAGERPGAGADGTVDLWIDGRSVRGLGRPGAAGTDPLLRSGRAESGTGGGPSRGRALSRTWTGWGRLLLAQSALLSGGRPAVDAFLAEQAQSEEPPAEPIDQEENDQEEPELSPVQHGEVVEYTNLGKDDGSYLTTDQIYVKNSTQGQEVDVATLASQPVDLKLGAGPQILIVHTHGSEAYTQDEQDVYVESDPYRTTDCTKTWSGGRRDGPGVPKPGL